MANILKNFDAKKTGIFAGGVLFGTAGIKILASDDAKKFYANCTAAVLRAKSCVMKVVTSVQENAEDIYAEAVEINEERAAKKECFEDEAEDFEEVDDEAESADAEAAAEAEQLTGLKVQIVRYILHKVYQLDNNLTYIYTRHLIFQVSCFRYMAVR